MPIHPSDHNTSSKNYHLINHFPTSTYDDSCFVSVNVVDPINICYSSFHYLGSCRIVEALHLLLLVTLGPHNHEIAFEQD